MKHLPKIMIPVIVAVVLWLVFGFISYNWNPANWSIAGRGVVVILWIFISGVAAETRA